MKPLQEKLLLGAVIILILLQVIELPASFNKIGIPYGAKQLNSQGIDVYKVASGSLTDRKTLWASTDGLYQASNWRGAGLAYGHLGTNSNAIMLAVNDENNNIINYVGMNDIAASGISFYNINGVYQFLPDWSTSTYITIYDAYYNAPCLRIVRQGNNDYRLQVMQSGSWVTK